MGGKIQAYIDCVSMYSVLAFNHLLSNLSVLEEHGVELEFIPVFLGGINHGSGNQPPWMLPAKAKYSSFESPRALKYFGLSKMHRPTDFPINSLIVQRAMCYVKTHHPRDKFASSFRDLCATYWEDDVNISKPEELTEVFNRHFARDEAQRIVRAAAEKEWKDQLQANTNAALSRGAFGAPWLWVTNQQGVEAPFFGSDRFHHIYQFLSVPFQDITIIPKAKM